MEKLHNAILSSIDTTIKKYHINKLKAERITKRLEKIKNNSRTTKEYEKITLCLFLDIVTKKEISQYTLNCIRYELTKIFTKNEYTEFLTALKLLSKEKIHN